MRKDEKHFEGGYFRIGKSRFGYFIQLKIETGEFIPSYGNPEDENKYPKYKKRNLVILNDKEQIKEVFETLTQEDLGTLEEMVPQSLKDKLPESDKYFDPQLVVFDYRKFDPSYYLVRNWQEVYDVYYSIFEDNFDYIWCVEKPEEVAGECPVTQEMVDNAPTESVKDVLEKEIRDHKGKLRNYKEEMSLWNLKQQALKGDRKAAYVLIDDVSDNIVFMGDFSSFEKSEVEA